MKYFCGLMLCMLICTSTHAQDLKAYTAETYVHGEDTLSYRMLLPVNFDPAKSYPLLIFLHGSGESGSDNQSQLKNGGMLFLKESFRKDFPSIVIFPQCPANSFWSNTQFKKDSTGKTEFILLKGGKPSKAMHGLLGMINTFLKKPYVNKSQIYAGGLSMGAMGTYELLRRKPKLFAAAFAICGADNVENVKKYKKIPLWIFQGAKDPIVNPQYAQAIANELNRTGREVKFTMYADAGHNSWDAAFAEPALFSWLFSHRK
jgi:predicted peptidase